MPRVIHFEIHADEPERAMRFYRSVFGWEFTSLRNMPVDYWAVKTGDTGPGIDGGLLRRQTPLDGAAVSAFACTVAVPDLDTYVMKVTTSGGQLAVPRMTIQGFGWLAYCKDTEGNLFGMMQADAAAR
ncbi:MAG TPA: VOC family protein [Gammaproteobacteria bacterium]|nr:VOC family protein [Gammaproteobacteria bacterium]